MPLTGKQEVVLAYGANSGTVQMVRPVTRLDVTLLNHRTTAINTNSTIFFDNYGNLTRKHQSKEQK